MTPSYLIWLINCNFFVAAVILADDLESTVHIFNALPSSNITMLHEQVKILW